MRHEYFVAGTIVAVVCLALFAYLLSVGSNVAVAGFLGPFSIGAGSSLSLIKLAVILIGIAVFAIIMVAVLVPRLRRKHGFL